MNFTELKDILHENGIVGAGGAGFPSYAKLSDHAEVIVLNCAECEPLLKLHRQLMANKAQEILSTLSMVASVLGVQKAVIGIKEEYESAVAAIKQYIDEYPNVELKTLGSSYPLGDEVVLIYETTGKVIRPGGLPIEEGVIVFNVETMYNIHRAVNNIGPVTHKLVTVVGEVKTPGTFYLPLGMTFQEAVKLANGVTCEEPVYLIGGPMMGNIGFPENPITKTTNAIVVLPKDHLVIRRKNRKSAIDIKRAASACCQCQTCTDLCPRHSLGHPIEPHKFMRAVANSDFSNTHVFTNAMFCSSCGLCENYSCPQGLSPRSLIADYKAGLRKAGVKPEQEVKLSPIQEAREYRKVPKDRLTSRLGLAKYDVNAPIDLTEVSAKKVTLLLSQHIGAPAVAVVSKGDIVDIGTMVAKAPDALGTAIHSSIKGIVESVSDKAIVVKANEA